MTSSAHRGAASSTMTNVISQSIISQLSERVSE